jgi:hypothetical protein
VLPGGGCWRVQTDRQTLLRTRRGGLRLRSAGARFRPGPGAPVGARAVSISAVRVVRVELRPLVLLVEVEHTARLRSRVRARVRQPQVLARVQLTDGLSSDQSSSRDGAGGLFRIGTKADTSLATSPG